MHDAINAHPDTPRAAVSGDGPKQLGRAIRRARLPWSQTQLAAALGCPQSTISMWENGRAKLSPGQVNRVEEVLGLPAGRLLIEAGFVDSSLCPRSQGSGADARQAVVWRPGAGTPPRLPERVVCWLDTFRPLIDAICVLRTTAYDDHALHALLGSPPVLMLRVGWELWEHWELASDSEGEDPATRIGAVLGESTYRACRYALWGDELAEPRPLNVVPFGGES